MLMEIEHLCKTYCRGPQAVEALRDVNLSVDRGEFLAILGPSGSGKSTLMHLLGCLDLPTSGRYLLDGRDISRLRDKELCAIRSRMIGFIFQSFNLIGSMDALENTALPLFYRGIPRSERLAAAQKALQQVGLGHRLHHRPAELSGGQQQRVAIARAIAADPAILLADEPTGNLDPAAGQEVMEILCALHREGRTVILITHDAAVAARAARAVQIRDGRLQPL